MSKPTKKQAQRSATDNGSVATSSSNIRRAPISDDQPGPSSALVGSSSNTLTTTCEPRKANIPTSLSSSSIPGNIVNEMHDSGDDSEDDDPDNVYTSKRFGLTFNKFNRIYEVCERRCVLIESLC